VSLRGIAVSPSLPEDREEDDKQPEHAHDACDHAVGDLAVLTVGCKPETETAVDDTQDDDCTALPDVNEAHEGAAT